jgi:hypothetical protein
MRLTRLIAMASVLLAVCTPLLAGDGYKAPDLPQARDTISLVVAAVGVFCVLAISLKNSHRLDET